MADSGHSVFRDTNTFFHRVGVDIEVKALLQLGTVSHTIQLAGFLLLLLVLGAAATEIMNVENPLEEGAEAGLWDVFLHVCS